MIANFPRAELLLERETRRYIADQLRLNGNFGRFMARGERKRQALRKAVAWEPDLNDTKMNEDDLWEWYFAEVLQTERPTSLPTAARRFGFEDVRSFRAAVIRERLFQRCAAASEVASDVVRDTDAIDGNRFDPS